MGATTLMKCLLDMIGVVVSGSHCPKSYKYTPVSLFPLSSKSIMTFFYYDPLTAKFHHDPPHYTNTTNETIMPYDDATTIQPLPPTAPTPQPVPPSPMDVDISGGVDISTPPGVAWWHNTAFNPFYAPTPYVVEPGGDVADHNQSQDNPPSEMDEQSDGDQQEQDSYLPSPAQTPDRHQILLPRVNVFPFLKPPHQDFIQDMIVRSRSDQEKYPADTVNANTSIVPASSDISEIEEASRKYYETLPMNSPLREGGSAIAYHYPLKDICFLQERLFRDWADVVPPPIPIIILKPTDYIGPRCIRQGESGWIFAIPNLDTIWSAVLERGVDIWFRPMAREQVDGRSQLVSVVTEPQQVGRMTCTPHEIVTSRFAVNVFKEVPRSPAQALEKPEVEYLGAFLLQHVKNLKMMQSVWDGFPDMVKDYLYDKAPHLFEGLRPFKKVPRIPFVKLLYVKFDKNLVGCADGATLRKKVRKAWQRFDRERLEEHKKLGEEDPGNLADAEDHESISDVSALDSDGM